MSAGNSGTPLPKKLGIKEGNSVAVLAAPAHFADLVTPLPAGARLLPDFDGDGPCEVIVAFVTSHAELIDRFARGRELLDPFGGLWLAWPKQSSPSRPGPSPCLRLGWGKRPSLRISRWGDSPHPGRS